MPAPIKVFSDYFAYPAGGASSDTEPSLRALPNGRLELMFSTDAIGGSLDRAILFALPGVEANGFNVFNTSVADDIQIAQAIAPSGIRLMTWTRVDDATGDQDVWARVMSPTTPLQVIKDDFAIDPRAGAQFQPQAVPFADDSFLVVWVDGNVQRVRGTVIDYAGTVLLPPFDISAGAVSLGFDLGLDVLTSRRAVVSYRLDNGNTAFRFVIETGVLGAEIDYDGVAGGTGPSAVAALADGRFAIVSQDTNGNGNTSGRIFNPDGTLSVAEFNILASGDNPKAVGLPDGRFFVINSDVGGEIVGQMMKPDGTKDGGVVAINTVTVGTQANADMTLLPDGRIAIAWATNEGSSNDIKMTIFDPRESGIDLAGTPTGDNYVGSSFNDVVLALAGSDVVDGGAGDDLLIGGPGNDDLIGGAGADTLRGGDDNDLLDGGPGLDFMSGGPGNDRYFIDSLADVVEEPEGQGTQDRIYAPFSYTLPAGLEIELLTPVDFASTAPLSFAGNAFAQTIFGNAGNNNLDGVGGGDTLVGLGGNDNYFVRSSADRVVETAGNGSDRVYALASFALEAGSHVEILSTIDNLATTAINLTGNALVQAIFGNAGANTLDSGGGGDTLVGLGGNDFYFVRSASDRAVEAAGEGTGDRVFAAVSYSLEAGTQIEILSTVDNLATTAINLTGNSLQQFIFGNAGANILDSGGGNDTMMGFGGDDFYFIRSASDRSVEAASAGNDRVFSASSYALEAGSSIEMMTPYDFASTNALDFQGNALSQSIFGNAGANNLDGGGGGDTLIGLGGNDNFFVRNSADRAVETIGNGNDRVFALVSFTLEAGSHVEMITPFDFASVTAINLTGNELVQTIFGNDGVNTLDGKGGSDTLVGLGGADTFAFTTTLGASNVDTISGFVAGVDEIGLDDAIFTGLAPGALPAGAFRTGSAAADADDRIIYDPVTGGLYFDVDGTGAAAQVLFAALSPGLALAAGDFVVV